MPRFAITDQFGNEHPIDPNDPRLSWNFKLPPNPRTESEETIEKYEEREIARRALRIAQGYIEIAEENS